MLKELFKFGTAAFRPFALYFFSIYKAPIRKDKQSIHKKLYTKVTVEQTTLHIGAPSQRKSAFQSQATSPSPAEAAHCCWTYGNLHLDDIALLIKLWGQYLIKWYD